jgi:uncharacterized protein (UPF0261 family)
MSAGPRRLTVAGAAGVPQVVSIGAVDMVNFGPRSTVPDRFRDRQFYEHNAHVTLMRTTPAENAEIGRRMGERLNGARGPVTVLLPLQGVSAYSAAGGPFYDPAADAQCLAALRATLDPRIRVREIDANINDEPFARAAADALLALVAAPAEPA